MNHLTPQARRRLHRTMSRSELADLAQEIADHLAGLDADDIAGSEIFHVIADHGRDDSTARD